MRLIKIGMVLGWILGGAWGGQAARGDGGTVRLSRCEGSYRISVLTSPTPFRAGPVDISVLVQDVATGEPMPDARVKVRLTPCDRPGQPVLIAATTEAATNKLLRAAVFELPEPGRWTVEIAVTDGQGNAQVGFELEAAGRAPQWPAMWPWVGWPALVILLFSIHQRLVWRKSLQSR